MRVELRPSLHLQERFTQEDLPELCRLYRICGAPQPPDVARLRLLLAESDMTLALRAGGPDGPMVAFARVLTDFTREAVVVDVLAQERGRISADKLRATVVAAAIEHPLLSEVSSFDVRETPRTRPPSPGFPWASRPRLALVPARSRA